jgi:3-oxoacyl-[acyl-carrier-protein] synthase II
VSVSPGPVCVTGMAWRTPLGDTLDGVWARLLAGQDGLRDTPSDYPLRTSLAGIVPGLPGPGEAAPLDRQVELTSAALLAAFESAGVDPADGHTRIVAGTSYGPCLDEPAGAIDSWIVASARRIGHPGRPVCVGTACSAGSDAIAVAALLIGAGITERCVAGGADIVTAAKRLGHSALGTMSHGRLHPFDQRRDGMVPGEGAAFLVLESARSARRRGAALLGVLLGSGSSNDAAGLTAPDPSGDSVLLAMRRCLAAAGRRPDQVAVLNAHATGTPVNDDMESRSLRRMFGPSAAAPVVFATKGALGHSLGATGAIEAVSVLLALRDGLAPPVAGLADPIAGFPLPVGIGRPLPVADGCGASLTIGFGGFNTCLLFERAGGQ